MRSAHTARIAAVYVLDVHPNVCAHTPAAAFIYTTT